MVSYCGVILAGGRSSRMNGRMKSLLPVAGVSMIERISLPMSKLCRSIVAVAAYEVQAERLQQLGLTVVMDEAPDCGPLAAFHTALQHVEEDIIWLSACDMPLANLQAADWMVRRLLADGASAVIPSIGGKLHPLQAIYRKEHCLAAATALIAAGERSMMKLLHRLDPVIIEEDEFIKAGLSVEFVSNINTAEDYDSLLDQFFD